MSVMKYQIQKSLCDEAGFTGTYLNECNIHGSTAAGDKLRYFQEI